MLARYVGGPSADSLLSRETRVASITPRFYSVFKENKQELKVQNEILAEELQNFEAQIAKRTIPSVSDIP